MNKSIVALDVEYYNSATTGGHPTQVAIIDENGDILFNKYFNVTDPSIKISLEKQRHLKSKKLENWLENKYVISSLLKNHIVAGHDLDKDFDAMGLNKDDYETIDTAKITDYMRIIYQPRKLKNIAKEFLKRNIQTSSGSHDAVEDAKASLDIIKQYLGKSKSNNIPDLLSFVDSPNNFSKNVVDFNWSTIRSNRNTTHMNINEFLEIPYANMYSPLIHTNNKTRKNYAKNMEGLVLNRIPPSTKNNDINTFLNMPYANRSSPSLLQFPAQTRKNYSKNMEDLVINTQIPTNKKQTNMNIFLNIPYANRSSPLLQFPSQTRKNYAKNMEGLEMPLTVNAFVGKPNTRKNGKLQRLGSYIQKKLK
jgi:hypothetical protein